VISLNQLPNVITVARILLVLPIVGLILAGEFGWALFVFFAAGMTDGVDGYLARRFGWVSRFGAIADPLSDKALMLGALCALTWQQIIPLWLFVLLMVRDVVIVSGGVTYHYLIGPFRMKPTKLGKGNTLAQILFVLFAMVLMTQWSWLPSWVNVDTFVMTQWVIAGLALLSGGEYVYLWSIKALRGRIDTELEKR